MIVESNKELIASEERKIKMLNNHIDVLKSQIYDFELKIRKSKKRIAKWMNENAELEIEDKCERKANKQ